MDATFTTRSSAVRWPAALARWGVTPAVAGLWALHELIVGLAVIVPIASGPNPAAWGLPWARFDVGWYAHIARAGYPLAHLQTAAYFPGVPAYLWLSHSPVVALAAMQIVLLALIVQIGRLGAGWGLTGWRITLAQALVTLSPAAAFYSTTYPEAWMAWGICGALVAMKAERPWRAAAWSALAGVMDPLGLLVGVGAGVWAVWGLTRRDWAAFRRGIVWGLGSLGALLAVMATLAMMVGRPLAFIGAQRAWGAHWLLPGVQVAQALAEPRILPATLAALAVLPVVLGGLCLAGRAAARGPIHASALAMGVILFLVPLAFYSNRAPLSSTALFLSVDIPAVLGLSAGVSRRVGEGVVLWSGLWALAGAVLFTHGWFWG